MKFVGDSIQEYINSVGKVMAKKYNISAGDVIKCMLHTGFYGYIRCNYSIVKAENPEYWADKIFYLIDNREQFK